MVRSNWRARWMSLLLFLLMICDIIIDNNGKSCEKNGAAENLGLRNAEKSGIFVRAWGNDSSLLSWEIDSPADHI